ncbi:MAG: hypothetical protein IKM32_07785 [Clostridia bacterium]|nr:hypothetical protein [Clostridia bacterium]
MVGINKKTSHLFKTSVAFVLLVSLFALALAGCGETEQSSSAAEINSSASVSEAVSNSESSAAVYENSSSADTSSEDSSLTESEIESNTESSEANDESSVPEEESSEAESSEAESSEADTTIEPEILGTGTKNDPFLMIPAEDKTVTTYSIPAGESQYYAIYRVGGTILTIENENVSVEYEGIPYIAKKGKVVVKIAYALASDAILFEICNEGESDEAFLLQFENPEGTMANPKSVENISDDNSVSIPAGNETGYHFKYIAEKDGTLRFYMTASVASLLSVTNNSTSANRTSEETEAEYVEIEVKAGDELIIVVGAQRDKRNNIPAVDITWNAVYA